VGVLPGPGEVEVPQGPKLVGVQHTAAQPCTSGARGWRGPWQRANLPTPWCKGDGSSGGSSSGGSSGDSSSGSSSSGGSSSSRDSSSGSSSSGSGGGGNNNGGGNESLHGLSIASILLRILGHEYANKIINLGHLGQPGCLIGCSWEARWPLSVRVESGGNDQQLHG
jgi:hypothetical protein